MVVRSGFRRVGNRHRVASALTLCAALTGAALLPVSPVAAEQPAAQHLSAASPAQVNPAQVKPAQVGSVPRPVGATTAKPTRFATTTMVGAPAPARPMVDQPIDSGAANSGDYATDAFGDPMDFNNADDLSPVMRGLSVKVSGLRLLRVSTTNSVLAGTALPGADLVLADSIPMVIPWGQDTGNFPINADRYTQLTLSMYSSARMVGGAFYNMCSIGPTLCYNGSPFQINSGWHTYSINLKTASTYYRTRRWGGTAVMFGLMMNPGAPTNFQVDWIRLGTAGPVTLNPRQPQPTVISPSMLAGADYSTVTRGRPWNVQTPGDVELVAVGDAHYSAAGVRAKNVATSVFPRGNDPQLVLPVLRPIDGSRYNHFSVDVCYDGKFALTNLPGGGMNGRVIWAIAGEKGRRSSQDFLVFPGCQIIDLDLSGPPSVVEDESDARLPGGLRGFAGHSIVYLRFDPHEDPGTRYFNVHSIRLTARPTGAQGYNVQFADRNLQPGTTADVWLSPSPTGAGLRLIARAVPVTAGLNTFSWLGRDAANALVAPGTYYVKVGLSSPGGHTAVWASSPMVIGGAPALPGPVGGIQAVAGKSAVNLSWNAPVSGGAAQAYVVTATGRPSQTVSAAGRSATFTGLTNNISYRFTVAAANGAGRSAASAPVAVTPLASAGTYFPLIRPTRVLDTRATARVGAGGTITVPVTGGASGVPSSGVSAVAVNVTAVGPGSGGYLTVWPNGLTRPSSSNLNFERGVTVANMVIARVGVGGRIAIFNSSTTVNVVVDIVGYYSDGRTATPGSTFFPLIAGRVLDTRIGQGAPRRALGPRATIAVAVTGLAGVPATGVSAVVLNVAGVGPTTNGFVSAWATGTPMPMTSSLNLRAGDTRANMVVVRVGTGGRINLYNNVGSTNLIADVVGWFGLPGNLSGANLMPLSPFRIFDSRATSFTRLPARAIEAGDPRVLQLTGQGSGVPAGTARSVVANVTVVSPNVAGFVSMWPNGSAQPAASSLNYPAGPPRPNLLSESLPANGTALAAINNGSTNLIVDVMGWYG